MIKVNKETIEKVVISEDAALEIESAVKAAHAEVDKIQKLVDAAVTEAVKAQKQASTQVDLALKQVDKAIEAAEKAIQEAFYF